MATKKYNISNIVWDTDGDRDALNFLPSNYTLTLSVHPQASAAEIEDTIANTLSDKFGFETDSFAHNEVV